MISINLLPETLRKKKSSLFQDDRLAIPKEIIIGVGAIVVFLLLLTHGVLGYIQISKSLEYKKLSNEWKSFEKDRNNIENLLNQLNELRAKKDLLSPLMSEDVRWAHGLNVISDALPQGVWLRKIELKEGQLFIHGSAVSKSESEMLSVGDFVSALKAEEEFASDFEQIDVGVIKRRDQGTVSLVDFSVNAKVKVEQE